VPALRDVLDLCKGRIAVNIEIKKEAVTDIISGGIEEKCLKMVDQAGMQEHVVFSSFDPRALSHLRQIGHQAPVAVLFEKNIMVPCCLRKSLNGLAQMLSTVPAASLAENGWPI